MDDKFSITNISFIHWYDTKMNKDDNINKEQSTKNMVWLMDKVSYGADVQLSLQKEKGWECRQQIYFKIYKSYEDWPTDKRYYKLEAYKSVECLMATG